MTEHQNELSLDAIALYSAVRRSRCHYARKAGVHSIDAEFIEQAIEARGISGTITCGAQLASNFSNVRLPSIQRAKWVGQIKWPYRRLNGWCRVW